MLKKQREITFIEGELPMDAVTKTDWALTVQPLRDRPKVWALLKETDSSGNAYTTARTIAVHLRRKNEEKDFEVLIKRPEIGKWAIYAKYVGA